MERCDTESEDDLEGVVSRFRSGLRVLLSASSLCGLLDVLVSSSDVAVELAGSVLSKWWHTASERGGREKCCLGFKVSKQREEAE